MVFKKNDETTKLAAQKGGLKAQEKHPESAQIMNKRRDTTIYSEMCKKMNSNKEHQRIAGKMSRKAENDKAEMLQNKYEKMYQPFRVCDRICIKDGKLIFVEIKKQGQELRPLQKEFQKLCQELGYNYTIEYIIAPCVV